LAGNKNPWRDVCSPAAWSKVLELTRNDPTRNVYGPRDEDLFLEIDDRIVLYDRLEKRDARAIGARIEALTALEAACLAYLKAKHGGSVAPRGPGHKGEQKLKPIALQQIVRNKAKFGEKSIAPVATETGIDRWVISLAHRAAKKRVYLQVLREHLAKNIGKIDRVADFVAYVRERQQQDPVKQELLALTPGTVVEQWDPFHRSIELAIDEQGRPKGDHNTVTRAFVEWFAEDSPLPFLVWLEGHPMCVYSRYVDDWKGAQGPLPLDTTMVQYGATAAIQQVWIRGSTVVARGLLEPDSLARSPFVALEDGPKRGHAFVWLETGELLVHPHDPGRFHHSSFTSGGKVRCAGTILANHGKVTRLDNNSGHYQPTDLHFLALLEVLRKSDALAADVSVGTHRLTGKGVAALTTVPLDQFLGKVKDASLTPPPIASSSIAKLFC
jgi:hypothetical protein